MGKNYLQQGEQDDYLNFPDALGQNDMCYWPTFLGGGCAQWNEAVAANEWKSPAVKLVTSPRGACTPRCRIRRSCRASTHRCRRPPGRSRTSLSREADCTNTSLNHSLGINCGHTLLEHILHNDAAADDGGGNDEE